MRIKWGVDLEPLLPGREAASGICPTFHAALVCLSCRRFVGYRGQGSPRCVSPNGMASIWGLTRRQRPSRCPPRPWLLTASAATASHRRPGRGVRCGSDSRPGAVVLGSGEVLAKASSIAGTKAVMSWGPLLVTRFPSRTTSSSSQVASAFTKSSRMPGQEVRVRPLRSPADASTHGP